MKKVISLILVAAAVLAFSVTCFAADETTRPTVRADKTIVTDFFKEFAKFIDAEAEAKYSVAAETIFKMYKFRTMTDERDDAGNLLSDDLRLTKFGAWLRSTSLDELPEVINILKGDMSVVGPRPQLVRDMVFMTDEQRKRHNVRPGLTGLAQVSGRNAICWEDKLNIDLAYIGNIKFSKDVFIVFQTAKKCLLKEGITQENMATAEDYGDYLLNNELISLKEYKEKQGKAVAILNSKSI